MNNKLLLKIIIVNSLLFPQFSKTQENTFLPSNETMIKVAIFIGTYVAKGIIDAHVKGGTNLIVDHLIIDPTYRLFGTTSPSIKKNNSEAIMQNHAILGKLEELTNNQKEIRRANIQLTKDISKKDSDRYEDLVEKISTLNSKQREYLINLRENVVDQTSIKNIIAFENEHNNKALKDSIQWLKLCHSDMTSEEFIKESCILMAAKKFSLEQLEQYQEKQEDKKILRLRSKLRKEVNRFIDKSKISFEEFCSTKYYDKFSSDCTVDIKQKVSKDKWNEFIHCTKNCSNEEYLMMVNNLPK